jgi:catechol 2,3-dioxygenase-like lactoylglutathione lyase family enzyme
MLTAINPKLPMRNKAATRSFYIDKLGFKDLGSVDYDLYLIVGKDNIQLHFFLFEDLDPKENYGQVYIRTDDIEAFFDFAKIAGVSCTTLEYKPWMQREFSIHDPDNNLLTVGQSMV